METLARAVVRFRFFVILFWVAFAGFAVSRAARVGDVLSVEGESLRPNESTEVWDLIRTAFPRPFTNFIAVAITGPIPVDSQPFQLLVETLSDAAGREPYIDRVISHLTPGDSAFTSSDRRATFFLASVAVEHADTVTRAVPSFRSAMRRAAARHQWASQYDIQVTGEPALDWDVRTMSVEDAKRGELRALVPTAMILVLAFGALVAALLPLVIGVYAISCALAAVYFVGSVFPIAIFVIPIVTMVGLAVGIDYSLLIVTRFREEMNRGFGPHEAAVRSMTTAGRAVVISGLTVLIGFASLLLTPASETRSVGIGGLLVVMSAVILATTLLPAVLAVLGRRLDWPAWLARRLAWYHASTVWARWGKFVSQHRWSAMVVGLLLVAAIAWPATGIKIGVPPTGWFPAGMESTLGAETLERIGARGFILPVRVTVQAPEDRRIVGTRYLRGLMRLSDSLRADPRVAEIIGPVDVRPGVSVLEYIMLYSDLAVARERYPELVEAYVSEDGRTALMDVILTGTATPSDGLDVVRRIRTIAASGVRGLDSVTIKVGGFAAAGLDEQDDLMRVFPLMAGLVLVVTAIMLAVAFRSVLVPIKAVVMNLLSVAGAFGLIVLVFQRGIGAEIFGLDGPTETIFMVVPILVFAVAFGLSMDYEVFLLSRMKEAFDRTKDNDLSTMEGLGATASVITSAAAVMVVVFGTFAFSRVLVAQLLGFGLAVAVVLDATLIRMVLVPAFMHIAGRWNWWPGARARDEPPTVEALR